jgi:hypothetical protein
LIISFIIERDIKKKYIEIFQSIIAPLQAVGKVTQVFIPQTPFPLAYSIQIYPLFPHEAPQEF